MRWEQKGIHLKSAHSYFVGLSLGNMGGVGGANKQWMFKTLWFDWICPCPHKNYQVIRTHSNTAERGEKSSQDAKNWQGGSDEETKWCGFPARFKLRPSTPCVAQNYNRSNSFDHVFTAPLEVCRTETEWMMFTGRGLSFPVIIINILSGDHMWLYVQDGGGTVWGGGGGGGVVGH